MLPCAWTQRKLKHWICVYVYTSFSLWFICAMAKLILSPCRYGKMYQYHLYASVVGPFISTIWRDRSTMSLDFSNMGLEFMTSAIFGSIMLAMINFVCTRLKSCNHQAQFQFAIAVAIAKWAELGNKVPVQGPGLWLKKQVYWQFYFETINAFMLTVI